MVASEFVTIIYLQSYLADPVHSSEAARLLELPIDTGT